MAYLLERDTLNGKEGRAYCTINGQQIEMFSLKKIQVDCSLEEADMKVVGTRLVQKKTTGMTFSGSMDMYYGTPEFRQMAYNYRRTGVIPYFTIQITNDDPATSVGRQTIILYNVKIQSIPIAMLDAETDILTETVAFSFTNFEILEAFNAPAQLGS